MLARTLTERCNRELNQTPTHTPFPVPKFSSVHSHVFLRSPDFQFSLVQFSSVQFVRSFVLTLFIFKAPN